MGDLVTVLVLGPTRDEGWRALPVTSSRFLAAADSVNGGVDPLPCRPGTSEEASRNGAARPFLTSHLAADLTTLRAASWIPGTAVALADACTSTGQIDPESPRRLLEGFTGQLEAQGLRVTVATQIRFRLVGDEACAAPDCELDAVLVHLCSLLYRAELQVESIAIAPSQGPQPGRQVTASFSPCDALTACDNLVFVHLATATHAAQHGLRAEFASTDRLTLGLVLKREDAMASTLAASAYAGLRSELADTATVRTDFEPISGRITLNAPASASGIHRTMARALASMARGVADQVTCSAKGGTDRSAHEAEWPRACPERRRPS